MRGLDEDENRLFLRGPPPSARIILVLVVSVVLMILDHSRDDLSPVRAGLATVIQPVQSLAEMPYDLADTVSAYLDRGQLAARNESLERRVLLMERRLQKLASLQAENQRIRGLLASSKSLREEVLIAEIMSLSPDPYRHHVKLNKGTLDGVFEGQALVDANGIMGQVTEANPMGATAIMITDANHGIPVEFNRTGLQTIAQGTGQADTLLLPFLPSNADVQEGDLLVTSGLGGRYPPGYPVARVRRISHEAGNEFLTIAADPIAKLNRGREVLLVWRHQEDAEADEPAATGGGTENETSAPDAAAKDEADADPNADEQ